MPPAVLNGPSLVGPWKTVVMRTMWTMEVQLNRFYGGTILKTILETILNHILTIKMATFAMCKESARGQIEFCNNFYD